MSYKLTNYKNVDFFNEINNEEKAYWVGFIYADGCVSKDKNIFQVHLNRKDNDHLMKLGNIFGKKTYTGALFNKSKGKSYEYSLLCCCQKEIRNSLLRLGIHPNKTKLDCIEIFNFIPDFLIHHFVRGYFDGDGCITMSILNNGKTNYLLSIAGSSMFLQKIKDIIIKKVGVSQTKTFKQEGCYVIKWSGREQISLISDWLYKNSTIYLERKKNRFDEYYKGNKTGRGASEYRGVVWHKNNQKWLASISYKRKRINLGYYFKEVEAARAYDSAVIKYGKPLYKLNFERKI